MKTLYYMVLVLSIFFVSVTFSSIGCDDDDDDNNDSDSVLDDDTTDDDNINDDDATDDDVTDDDEIDDDAIDDDATDDDATDDDATDDDATDDDATDDDATDDDATDDDSVIADIDFEDYNLGELPDTIWEVTETGDATMRVVNYSIKGVTGKALQQYGGDSYGDETEAVYPFSDFITDDIRFSFDIISEDGTYGYFFVRCSHGTAAYLMFNYNSLTLSAYSYAIDKATHVTCAEIDYETQHHVEIEFSEMGSYTIMLDGSPTDCINLGNYFEAGDSYTHFEFSESLYADMMGTLYYDNILVEYILP